MPKDRKWLPAYTGLIMATITLAITLSITNNPLKKFLINSYARYSPDALINQRERSGTCSGAGCLAPEIIANSNDPSNQTGVAAEILATYKSAMAGDQTALDKLKEYNLSVATNVETYLAKKTAAEAQAQLTRDINILSSYSSTVLVYQSGGSSLSPCVNDPTQTRMCDLDTNAVLICQSRGGTDCSLHPREFAMSFLANNGVDQATLDSINTSYNQQRTAYYQQVIDTNRAISTAIDQQITEQTALRAINNYSTSNGTYVFSDSESQAIKDYCVLQKGTIIAISCADPEKYANEYIASHRVPLADQVPQGANIPLPAVDSSGTPSFVHDSATYINIQNEIATNNSDANQRTMNAIGQAAQVEATNFLSGLTEYAACQNEANAVDRASCNQRMYQIEQSVTVNNPIARITGVDNYIESFASGTTQAWQTLGYESINKCKQDHPNGLGPHGYQCSSTDYTKEQLTASITAGSRITEIASLPVSIGYAASAPTILAGIGRTLGEIGVISTVDQTANTTNAWVNDPGSRETWTQTGLTALSWTNLGTADMISNAISRGGLTTANRVVNTVVSGVNLGVDVPIAINTWQDTNSSGWDRTMATGAVFFDIAGGIIDLRQGQLIWDPANSRPVQTSNLLTANVTDNIVDVNTVVGERGLAYDPQDPESVVWYENQLKQLLDSDQIDIANQNQTRNINTNPQSVSMAAVEMSMHDINALDTGPSSPTANQSVLDGLASMYNRLFPNAVDTQGVRFDQENVTTPVNVRTNPLTVLMDSLGQTRDAITNQIRNSLDTISNRATQQVPSEFAPRVTTVENRVPDQAIRPVAEVQANVPQRNILQNFLQGSANTGQIQIPIQPIRNMASNVAEFIGNIPQRLGQMLNISNNTIQISSIGPDQLIVLKPGDRIVTPGTVGNLVTAIPRVNEIDSGVFYRIGQGPITRLTNAGITIPADQARNSLPITFYNSEGKLALSENWFNLDGTTGIPANSVVSSSYTPQTRQVLTNLGRSIQQDIIQPISDRISGFTNAMYGYVMNNPPEVARQREPTVRTSGQITPSILRNVSDSVGQSTLRAVRLGLIAAGFLSFVGMVLATVYSNNNVSASSLYANIPTFTPTAIVRLLTNTPVPSTATQTTVPLTPTAAPQYLEGGTVLLTTDLAPDKYKLVAYLVSIFNQAMNEIGGIPTTQEEKNNYIKKVISLLTSSNQSPEMLRLGTQLANDNNFINYLNSRLNGADLGLRGNQLIQCNIWAVGVSVIYPDLNIVADKYQFTNGGAFYLSEIFKSTTNDMQCFGKTMKEALFDPRCQNRELRYQVEGDVIAARVTDYSKINAGDSFVYDYHIGVILDKYYINGKYWFLVTESNSPHDSPTGTPQMYLVSQDDFASRINDLNKTYFLYSGNDATVEKPTTPASATTPEVLRMITVQPPVTNNSQPPQITQTPEQNRQNFSYFSQYDERYSSIGLAGGDCTVANMGCSLMVASMVTNTDPKDFLVGFNEYLGYGPETTNPNIDCSGSSINTYRNYLEYKGYSVVPISGTGVSTQDVKNQIANYTSQGIPVWVDVPVWMYSGLRGRNGWVPHSLMAIGIDENNNIIFNDPANGQGVSIPDSRLNIDGGVPWTVSAIVYQGNQ